MLYCFVIHVMKIVHIDLLQIFFSSFTLWFMGPAIHYIISTTFSHFLLFFNNYALKPVVLNMKHLIFNTEREKSCDVFFLRNLVMLESGNFPFSQSIVRSKESSLLRLSTATLVWYCPLWVKSARIFFLDHSQKALN